MADKAVALGFNVREGERLLLRAIREESTSEEGFLFDTDLSNAELEKLGIQSSSTCKDVL